ncbi:MAG: glycosyltransferase family 4 protein [Myxococcota bacterium]|nr:glycosyltransferase family 4 protein [Myxococcota bacterium]
MHVAMVGPELDARGGIASVARALLGAPALSGHSIDYVPTMRDGSGARKAMGMAKRQASFIGRLAGGWRPDLFHIHFSYYTSFYRKMAYFEQARATGAPLVVHVHAPDLHAFHQASPVHAAAMRHVFTRADRVVALSEDMARTIRRLGGPGVAVCVVYNPVEIGAAPPVQPRDRTPTALFLGEIGQRKGTWDLVEAMPEVLAAVPEARFRVGGNGDVERLQRRLRELGIDDRVDVLGWVAGPDKTRELASATLLTLPSYQEGLPMSILEAMGAALPVVSTPIAGIPEAVLDGRTGYLVSPGDRSALAEKLTVLLSRPDEAARMGAAGRDHAEQHFALQVVASQLSDLWDDIHRRSRAP